MGLIVQLAEHCSANAEATGLNPAKAPIFFFGLNSQLLKLRLQVRWSHLHFNFCVSTDTMSGQFFKSSGHFKKWKDSVQ